MTMETPPPGDDLTGSDLNGGDLNGGDLAGDDLPGDDGIGGSGYSLDELSDYLDRGRLPAIAAIDDNAECQSVLSSLERVSALSRDLIAQDAEDNPTVDESWLGALFASISQEAKAGRDIPLASPDPRTRLSITEGAVRELVRAAGDSVDGVLVGRCQLDGDVDSIGDSIRVSISISVLLGTPVHEAAEAVRQRVYSELLTHTELTVEAVDVTVADVHVMLPGGDAS